MLIGLILILSKLNIYDDFVIDNGMNSNNSYSVDEELIEVECIIEGEKNSKKYWLNKTSGVIYDYNDKYVIGTVKKDGDSYVNYMGKLIIDKLVFYPEVKV